MKETSNPPIPDCDALASPTGAKTVLVIELLARHPEGITAAGVARQLGFTPNLVYRILRTLAELGWATQREDSSAYVLTNRLLQLAGPQVGEESLTLAAHQPLRELRDACGETVQLLIEIEGKMSVLEQFRGTQALQVSGQVGMRVPMYSCAPGKAILAAWSEDRRDAWFRTRGRTLKKFTATTLSTRTALKEDLEKIQARGFATDLAEGIEGIHCVAVVIRDGYGQPVGAITAMAPASRLQEEDFPELVAQLQQTRDRIEARLAG